MHIAQKYPALPAISDIPILPLTSILIKNYKRVIIEAASSCIIIVRALLILIQMTIFDVALYGKIVF